MQKTKTLSQLKKTISQHKGESGSTSYYPKGGDEQRFMDKHTIEVTDDANGNDDEMFKGTKVKYVNRASEKHGYDSPNDARVHEETDIEEELTSSEMQMHRRMAAKHTALAKQSKGALKDQHRTAAEDHKFAAGNPWYAKAHTDALKSSKKLGVAMEEVELDERELSTGEMKKREDYVKGMKKNLSGFKQRYGKDAKAVMYATATKMAKEEYESEEVDVELLELFISLSDDNRALMIEMLDNGLEEQIVEFIREESEELNG